MSCQFPAICKVVARPVRKHLFPVNAVRRLRAVFGGIPQLLPSGVLVLSAYATKIGRSLLLAGWDMTLWGVAFEDFLGRQFEPDGRNFVGEYLRRRGWNESAPTKAYIRGLRNSIMSLYEASAIVSRQSFLARDLVRGGDPVLISERTATRTLKEWDRIASCRARSAFWMFPDRPRHHLTDRWKLATHCFPWTIGCREKSEKPSARDARGRK